MIPTDGNERDILAAEYVLGLLSSEQADDVVRALALDDDLRDRVTAWEERFAPAAALATPVSPDLALWQGIENVIQAGQAARPLVPRQVSGVAGLWHSLGFWRAATAIATMALVAAVLVLPGSPSSRAAFVAVLQTREAPENTGWIVQIKADRTVQLIPLRHTDVDAQRVLQFWTLIDPAKGPISLGLVPAAGETQIPASRLPAINAEQLFEITLEPSGGSPIGRPTGPILYIGRAAAVASL